METNFFKSSDLSLGLSFQISSLLLCKIEETLDQILLRVQRRNQMIPDEAHAAHFYSSVNFCIDRTE